MIHWLTSTTVGRLAATFIISMLPVVELRGGIPYGVGFGLKPLEAFFAAFLGNLFPIPFVLLLFNGILEYMKGCRGIVGKAAGFLERKAYKNQKTIEKYKELGLIILVAIPLPGTGAWTGALVATVLGIERKKAFLCIVIGVTIAGAIMMAISYGVAGLFG